MEDFSRLKIAGHFIRENRVCHRIQHEACLFRTNQVAAVELLENQRHVAGGRDVGVPERFPRLRVADRGVLQAQSGKMLADHGRADRLFDFVEKFGEIIVFTDGHHQFDAGIIDVAQGRIGLLVEMTVDDDGNGDLDGRGGGENAIGAILDYLSGS